MEIEVEKKVLNATEAMALYEQGKDKWNAWIDDNQDWSIDFRGYEFLEKIDFCDFKFRNVCFHKVNFSQGAIFTRAIFLGVTIFSEAKFHSCGKFNGSKFSGVADFSTIKIFENADFNGSEFSCDCTFENSEVGEFSFRSVKVGKKANFKHFIAFVNCYFTYSIFHGIADFSSGKFHGDANFSSSRFFSISIFKKCEFYGAGYFSNIEFSSSASFTNVVCHGESSYVKSIFHERADFLDAEYREYCGFNEVEFKWMANFTRTNFGDDVSFVLSRFSIYSYFVETECHSNFNLSRCFFEKDVDFSNMKISGVFNVINSKFLGSANLTKCTFVGDVAFDKTIFYKNVVFINSSFESDSSFLEAKFLSDEAGVDFGCVVFEKKVNMSETYFEVVPDFRFVIIKEGFYFYGVKVRYSACDDSWRKEAKHKNDADRYCKLKEMAIEAKDVDAEKRFFSYELRAKRFHHFDGSFDLGTNFCYDWFSDYGLSLKKPIVWLFMIYAFCTVFFQHIFSVNNDYDSWSAASNMSFSQLFPFLGMSRTSRENILSSLPCGGEELSPWFYILGYTENILGIIFIFLVGLALRNRFKI